MTDTFTAADLAEYIPERWSGYINDFFRSKLAAANFFMDLSDEIAAGGDIINIPNVTEPAATTKSNATAVTVVSATETATTLTCTTWKESSFAVEDNEASQVLNSYNIQKIYADAGAYACAKSLDTALLGLYSGLDHSVNDSASAVADADILDAIKSLDAHDVPSEDRMFFFCPEVVWGDLMAIDKYTLTSNMGVATGAASGNGGIVGYLYGIPVTSTNQVVNTHTDYEHNLLAQKSAFVWGARRLPGAQGPVRVSSGYLQHYLATITTADIVYGVAELNDGAACEIRSIT